MIIIFSLYKLIDTNFQSILSIKYVKLIKRTENKLTLRLDEFNTYQWYQLI